MQWETFCTQYLTAYGSPNFDEVEQWLKSELAPHIVHLTPQDTSWLTVTLADPQRKWFVAFVCELTPVLPDAFFTPLLQAAIYERNPSFNRWFVAPAITAFGHRRVINALLDMVETGFNFERAGAVNALYWANVPLVFKGTVPNFEKKHATPESQAAYDALADVWLRKHCLFLQEFISNPDLNVRRSLIPNLVLTPDAYPDQLKPLVSEAIQIARTHSDDYIRHRVKVQLGSERLLKPLPQREGEEGP